MAELESLHTGNPVKLHDVLRSVAKDFFHGHNDGDEGGKGELEVVEQYNVNGSLAFFHRTGDSFRRRSPQLKEAIRHASTDILEWMHKGGAWRALLVTTVGVVLLLGLAGLCAFMFFFLIATLNAVVIGFLGSVASVGAFTVFFFSSLIVVYIGAVIVAAMSISTITILCICGALTVAGWVGFFWLIWQGLKKGADIAKASCFVPVPTLPPVTYEKVLC